MMSLSSIPVIEDNQQPDYGPRSGARAAQACTRCRSRKVRCDGEHPDCSTCTSALAECVWPTLPNRRGRRPARTATSAPPANFRAARVQAALPETCVTVSVSVSDDSQTPTQAGQYFTERIEGDPSQLSVPHDRTMSSKESKPSWLCHGLNLPDRRGMVQLWEIFLRSTYVEIFGVFHKPTTTSQILRGQLSPELALGICMHAARFSTTEIAKYGTPLAAADFYGNAAATFLLSRSSMGTLDFIVAMLLLTLHEFSMKRGKEAWLHLGIAIRAVLSLDLGKEVAEDRLTSSLHAPWKLRECRRRCFWSAFVIERIIGSGNHAQNVLSGSPGLPRHHLIDLKDANIQLPSTENDFMFFRPVLTHDSAELGSRSFYAPLPPGDNTATFGHMVKVCKVWGEISRWAFAPVDNVQNLAIAIKQAHRTLTQWESELPERSKWNFENYSAHSVPGEALGCSFIFMHLVGRIGFVLLGLKTFDCALEELLEYALEDSIEDDPISIAQRDSTKFIKTAIDSAKFILDISNDPMNLLGTSFLDYALYLSSLLMMKYTLLNDGIQNMLHAQRLGAQYFMYQVLSVFKRRIHYWKLTRAYSRVLRVAYTEYIFARSQGLHSCQFQTSIEYGSIENMENRDVEIDNEAKEISELMSRLVSENSSNVAAVASAPKGLSADQDTSLGSEILDIDSLLAAQNAANAIQVSLSTTNDRWWNDLFGEEPMNMDQDLLLQRYARTDMSGMF